MEWIEFFVAMSAFLASHRLPVLFGLKSRLPPAVYYLCYSLTSLIILAWVIAAAGRAPFVVIWDQQIWHRWLVNLLMPIAILFASFGVLAQNPFAFEGRKDHFDPTSPGIAGITRQPLLWALALWSGAHLLPNGDLSHILLFGTFFGFALIGLIVMDRRVRLRLGQDEWSRLSQATSLLPGFALMTGRFRPRHLPSFVRLASAVIVWALLLHAHGPVIGVSPKP